jgi:ribose-phosphate pyrophosphokinase
MVDTAGTLVEATKTLLEKGAKDVHACVTHAVLSGPAIDRIEQSALKSLVVTDTLPLRRQAVNCEKIVVVPSCRLFCQAIRTIHNEDSISSLFEILH